MSRRLTRPADAATVAETVQTLAVLLQAGITPLRAWEHVAGTGDPAAVRVAAAVAAGESVTAAIAAHAPPPTSPTERAPRLSRRTGTVDAARLGHAWRDAAAAWGIATTVGAPLADGLRSIAAALRDTQEASDDVRIALAEPAATARLMGWLPLVGVALGFALGFDVIGVFVGGPLGIACVAAGSVLVIVGRRWNRSLIRRATTAVGIPGLEAELVALALSGGVSIDRARELVGGHLDAASLASTESVLTLSRAAGVPAVELLRASGALARHQARVDGRLRAAELSTRLLLPLGVCTLPAFLLLGVAPLLLSVLSAVPSTL